MLVKNKTYIIAEIGINHNGDINEAKKLIDKASETGVDAVKFQTYITEQRVDKNSPIFDVLKKCELPFKAFEELKNHCSQYDMDFFSTPFDIESVDLLYDLDIDLYKVASFDITNLKLLDYIAGHASNIIMSTGMSSIEEIQTALNIIGDRCDTSLLHCVSSYPTKPKDCNLSAIKTLKDTFSCNVGFSDHSLGIDIAVYSVLLGAKIVEKHFKIHEDCPDSPVSLSPEEMKSMVLKINSLPDIIGKGDCGLTSCQEPIVPFRRFSNV